MTIRAVFAVMTEATPQKTARASTMTVLLLLDLIPDLGVPASLVREMNEAENRQPGA